MWNSQVHSVLLRNLESTVLSLRILSLQIGRVHRNFGLSMWGVAYVRACARRVRNVSCRLQPQEQHSNCMEDAANIAKILQRFVVDAWEPVATASRDGVTAPTGYFASRDLDLFL